MTNCEVCSQPAQPSSLRTHPIRLVMCDDCLDKEIALYQHWKKAKLVEPPGHLLPFLRAPRQDYSPLLNFLTDRSDRPYQWRETIHFWEDGRWEASHDFVQWAFPTKKKSMFNPNAPDLTDRDIEAIRNDGELYERFDAASRRFLKFLGLYYATAPEPIVLPGPNFKEREWLWAVTNHNWLRITRFLDCLTTIGFTGDLGKLPRAMLECLERLVEQDCGSPNALQYWREAVTGGG